MGKGEVTATGTEHTAFAVVQEEQQPSTWEGTWEGTLAVPSAQGTVPRVALPQWGERLKFRPLLVHSPLPGSPGHDLTAFSLYLPPLSGSGKQHAMTSAPASRAECASEAPLDVHPTPPTPVTQAPVEPMNGRPSESKVSHYTMVGN